MAQRDVEVGQEFVDAVNHGDIDAALRIAHPDVVFEPLRTATEGAFAGRDGLKRFLLDTTETFEVFNVDLADVRDCGNCVVAIGSIRIRGRGSKIDTEVLTASVSEYRDGLLWRYRDYGDKDQALEAAGLKN